MRPGDRRGRAEADETGRRGDAVAGEFLLRPGQRIRRRSEVTIAVRLADDC
jgi:hypothetical protein